MTFKSLSELFSRRRVARGGVAILVAVALAAGYVGGRSTLSAGSDPAPAPNTVSTPLPMSAPVGVIPSYADVVAMVAPAIATVRVDKQVNVDTDMIPMPFRDFFQMQPGRVPRVQRQAGLGSGVIIKADGYLLTNNHVIDDADHIRVDLADGRSLPAKLVGADPASDLALLRVDAKDLPTLSFGNSDSIRVGDVVLAFGNPLGVGQTVTMGIVSAKGRTTGVGDGDYEDFLQTDAPINQGNSGGALVNLQGQLVGINAQILSTSGGNIGLGFAIPASMAQMVSEQLIDGGVVHRSKLGVTVQAVTPELAEGLGSSGTHGALVSEVEPGSPAEKAGVQQGDVITALDGRAVADTNALRNQIASRKPGTSVSLDVLRNAKPKTMTATLVEQPGQSAAADSRERSGERRTDGESALGMSVAPVTPRLARQFDLSDQQSGLVVTDVNPEGAAAAAGLRPGDVVVKANNVEVSTVAALRSALAGAPDRPAVLLVNRGGTSLFVAIPDGR